MAEEQTATITNSGEQEAGQQTDLIDRSAFDEAFGTDTSFEMGQAADTTASTSTTGTATSESSSAAATSTTSSENPFQAFLDWFFGLFS